MYISWVREGVPPQKARTEQAPTGLIRITGVNLIPAEDLTIIALASGSPTPKNRKDGAVTIYYELIETSEVSEGFITDKVAIQAQQSQWSVDHHVDYREGTLT